MRFDTYLKALRETPTAEQTEHTSRAALEALLKTFAVDAARPSITVQHEPKRETDKGAPDFKIKASGMILGYVEVKEIGANLDKVLKTDQIARYRTLSGNIIVTDYLQFIRIDAAGKVLQREQLAFASDLDSRTVRVNQEKADAVSGLLTMFFSEPPQGLGRAEQLALALATRARMLRDHLTEELLRQSKAEMEGRLHGLFAVFKEQVFHDLSLKDFSDAFAQMLAYGLFLAKLNARDTEIISLDNVRRFIPGSFRLIRELVSFIEDLDGAEHDPIRWVIDEILSIINGLAIAAIREDLSFSRRKAISRRVRAHDEEEHRLFERDPFIYFYEDFLKAYDKETRKARGVYYTPPPVVNFIVRAVDDILKDTFGIADGLADHKKVTVLDFAAGTGTFLLEVMAKIFENIGGANSGSAPAMVREHMLKNLYGFEYLIAPYTIAHLKLSQYLKENGHEMADGERLQVFLTNTLEQATKQIPNALLPQLSAEVKAAQIVKDSPVLVILGNPPYSGHSKNNGKEVRQSIDGYKFTIEPQQIGEDKEGLPIFNEVHKPLGEQNSKWLNDDYVKFIRFAQLKMDEVQAGVVGIITNHSWLTNPTFRGMRQSLLRTFDQIWVVDLHGSSKPKEMVPQGEINENVFDITKGVAIAVFVKKAGIEKGVFHFDVWGDRISKYRECAHLTLSDMSWSTPTVFKPYYLMEPIDWTGWEDYGDCWQISDTISSRNEKHQIFEINVTGFQTHRDHFAIAPDKAEMLRRYKDMTDPSLSDSALAERYGIKSNRDWKIASARLAATVEALPESKIIQCDYRPFDKQYCYFGTEFMDYPRRELLDHVAGKSNLSLLAPRQIGSAYWRHALVSDSVAESCCISDESSEGNSNFPLWQFSIDGNRTENLTPAFRNWLNQRYDHHYSPEEILGYIYAVLHAPTYRRRYAEFLRIDFPRILFPDDATHFDALSALGWGLVQAHLMKDLPRTGQGQLQGRGSDLVEQVSWLENDRRVLINSTQSFGPIDAAVWDFHIGGYQVLSKYLKSRKGRKHFSPKGKNAGADYPLSLDEITQIGRICDALSFTISQMEAIDGKWLAAFPDST
jgi:hypothetical protein